MDSVDIKRGPYAGRAWEAGRSDATNVAFASSPVGPIGHLS